MYFTFFSWYQLFEARCIFYMWSDLLDTFQVLNGHVWLEAATPDSTGPPTMMRAMGTTPLEIRLSTFYLYSG